MPRTKKVLDAIESTKSRLMAASKTGAIARQKANKPTTPVIPFPDASKATKLIAATASGVEAKEPSKTKVRSVSTEIQSDASAPTRAIIPSASDGEASDQQPDDESQCDIPDPRFTNPIIRKITILWHRRQMIVRQQTSDALRAQAILRVHFCDHDKVKAAKIYAELAAQYKKLKGENSDSEAYMAIKAFLDMQNAAQPHRENYDRDLTNLVKELPISKWAKKVRGFGEIGLAGIIGECGDLSMYRTVQGVYKRMGVAVIDGERQRRIAGTSEEKKALAIKHHYNPQRRSWLWNVERSLLKNQGKDEKALPYRILYDRKKAEELEKLVGTKNQKKHADNRALRYIGKCLLRDLTIAWRDLAA